MLVLSRKVGEQIVIADNIIVVVNRISGNRVSLGVEAPDDVKIIRGELDRLVRQFDGLDEGAVKPAVLAPTTFPVDDASPGPLPPRAAR